MKNEVKSVEEKSSYYESLKKVSGVKSTDLALQIIGSSGEALEPFLGEEKSVQTILSSLKDLEPQNASEARLATQATVLFEFAMKAFQRSAEAHQFQHIEAMAHMAIKLSRAHCETVECLNRCKRGSEQKITVTHAVMANQVQMNTNFNGEGPLQKTRGTTPCQLENVVPNAEVGSHVDSFQWKTDDAKCTVDFPAVRGLRQAYNG